MVIWPGMARENLLGKVHLRRHMDKMSGFSMHGIVCSTAISHWASSHDGQSPIQVGFPYVTTALLAEVSCQAASHHRWSVQVV